MTAKDPKALKISPRPERKSAATADEFVTGKATMKRFTFDISEELHRRVKIGAAREDVHVSDLVREFLEQRFPA